MKFLLLITLLTTQFAFAAERNIVLLSISNNFNSLRATLGLVLDENNDIIKIEDISTVNGRVTNHAFYSLKQAVDGFVLYKEKGRDICKLSSKNISAGNGGLFKLNYLYNGIFNIWRSYSFDLRRNGDEWAIYYDDRKVTQVELFANKKPFAGIVGLRSMRFK